MSCAAYWEAAEFNDVLLDMNEKSLTELIDESTASSAASLPVFPTVITQIRAALADPKSSPDAVAKQIALDASLAGQILRVANSPFYAGLTKIPTVKEAVMRLGIARIVQIATLVAQKGLFATSNPAFKHHLAKLWQHSVACALGSEWLAKRMGFSNLAEEVFMAGLFHDIGKLLLLKCLEETHKNHEKLEISEQLSMEILDRLHEEKGAQLLHSWNLPEIYCEIARTHHQEITSKTRTSALIVRVTDMVARKLGIALRGEPDLVILGSEEVSRLGLSDIVTAELEIALEDSLTLSA